MESANERTSFKKVDTNKLGLLKDHLEKFLKQIDEPILLESDGKPIMVIYPVRAMRERQIEMVVSTIRKIQRDDEMHQEGWSDGDIPFHTRVFQ